MDGFGGGDGGLAPLARAVDDAAVRVCGEDFELGGVGLKAELRKKLGILVMGLEGS